MTSERMTLPVYFRPRVHEVRILADRLLGDDSIRAIFVRVGIHGDLSREDEIHIERLFNECRADFSVNEVHRWEYCNIMAFCRRKCTGALESELAENAFIARNITRKEDGTANSASHHVDEILQFAEHLYDDPEMRSSVERHLGNEEWSDEDIDLYDEFQGKFFDKYALHNRSRPDAGLTIVRFKIKKYRCRTSGP